MAQIDDYFATLTDWVTQDPSHRIGFTLVDNHAGENPPTFGGPNLVGVARGSLERDGDRGLAGEGTVCFSDRQNFDPAQADTIRLRLVLNPGFESANPFPPPDTLVTPSTVEAEIDLVSWGGTTIGPVRLDYAERWRGLQGSYGGALYSLTTYAWRDPG